MTAGPSRIPLREACENIQSEFWATLGLEQGVQQQTEGLLDTVRETAASLPDMSGVALVPFGSRIKGYARLDSDLDLAVIHYDKEISSYYATIALNEAIDMAPNVSLIDFGYGTTFSPRGWPLSLAPTIFEGEQVARLRCNIIESWLTKSEVYLEHAERAYADFFIDPRFLSEGAATRFSAIANTPEAASVSYEEIEASFDEAYKQRLYNFGGNILEKIEQALSKTA